MVEKPNPPWFSFKKRIEVPGPDGEEPGEVIYEVITAEDNLGFGLAVAEICSTRPHYHQRTTELYLVLDGELMLELGDKEGRFSRTKRFFPGQLFILRPGHRHAAKSLDSVQVRVAVITFPAWSQEDHILVETVGRWSSAPGYCYVCGEPNHPWDHGPMSCY